MFKETFDSLHQIDIKGRPNSIKAEYYFLMSRYYYDLADYDNHTFYSPVYTNNGTTYIDSAITLFPANSFEHIYYSALKNYKEGKIENAYAAIQTVLSRSDLTLHQLAMAASTLSYIYIKKEESNKAVNFLIKAAIADIKSSTKETLAIFNLAELLYKSGDIDNASLYIEKAITDASFYGHGNAKCR